MLEILGVTIDSKLIWKKHTSNISSRAGQHLALRRVANNLDARGRENVYKAQVHVLVPAFLCPAMLCWYLHPGLSPQAELSSTLQFKFGTAYVPVDVVGDITTMALSPSQVEFISILLQYWPQE